MKARLSNGPHNQNNSSCLCGGAGSEISKLSVSFAKWLRIIFLRLASVLYLFNLLVFLPLTTGTPDKMRFSFAVAFLAPLETVGGVVYIEL